MSEIFTQELINNVIAANRHIVAHRGESFGCNIERLGTVFNNVNSFNNISDKRLRIIKKAAHLLGGITWQQPFSNGNKSTALVATKYFLRKNGFDLRLLTPQEEDELIDLLTRTIFKFEDDSTIITEVEEYLLRKVEQL